MYQEVDETHRNEKQWKFRGGAPGNFFATYALQTVGKHEKPLPNILIDFKCFRKEMHRVIQFIIVCHLHHQGVFVKHLSSPRRANYIIGGQFGNVVFT